MPEDAQVQWPPAIAPNPPQAVINQVWGGIDPNVQAGQAAVNQVWNDMMNAAAAQGALNNIVGNIADEEVEEGQF